MVLYIKNLSCNYEVSVFSLQSRCFGSSAPFGFCHAEPPFSASLGLIAPIALRQNLNLFQCLFREIRCWYPQDVLHLFLETPGENTDVKVIHSLESKEMLHV